MRFTKEKNLISYKDILKNKNGILKKENFVKLERDIVSRLLLEIKELNLLELSQKETENFITFLKYAEEEQRVTFLFDMVSDYKYDNDNFKVGAKNNMVTILNSFPVEKEVVKKKLNS